jgi:hypothetical protein
MSIGPGLEIRADGLHFDATVAFDFDRGHGLSGGGRRCRHGGQRASHRRGEQKQSGQQASPYSHSNIHPQRALAAPEGNYWADVAKKSSNDF